MSTEYHAVRFAPRPTWDALRLRVGVLATAAVFYAWALSRGSFDPFGPENFGLVFNSMLDHMLRGGWTVDPAIIGREAFVHDGRSYAYFGPVPAILRLPLTLWPDWRALHVERLSCWVAIMLGVAAQTSAVVASLARAGDPGGRTLAPPLIIACAMSGPPMLLGWKGALLYHEPILWAWALAMVFVALALPETERSGPFHWRRLCGVALCAGLCLLTRSTTGAGLYLAAGLLLLSGLAARGNDATPTRRPLWHFGLPLSILVVFLILAGCVNEGRWGSPFVFADLRLQTALIDAYPDRLGRMQHYGLFDWRRLGTGLMYYVFPVWTEQVEHLLPLKARVSEIYDAVEQPATSLWLTDPLWCLLSVQGVLAIVRRRASAGETLVATGVALAPAAMLVAWYLAFRYRVEFSPLLLVLSCVALRHRASGWLAQRSGRVRPVLWLLCAVQLCSGAAAGWYYALQPFGPAPGVRALSLHCAIRPDRCVMGSDEGDG